MTGGGNRVALVTGASGAIGEAIARGIAEVRGYDVVLACRDEARARASVERIRDATGNDAVRYEIVDLSTRDAVASFAARWHGPLHVLVNNAAVTPRKRLESADGLELQFATNVMGYLWAMHYLEPALCDGAPSRVVNVASYWAGDLDLADLQFERRRYNNDTAYRQSKQANRMLSVSFARRWRRHGISVNACHPGDVASRLSANLGFGGHQSPEQAAETPVWLATAAGLDSTGAWFSHRRRERCRFAADDDAVAALYDACHEHI